jgi:hypothetical protein
MKNIGLILAILSVATGAVYAGIQIYNRTKNMATIAVKKVKAVKGSMGENKISTPSQSSISKSYTYVAEDF